MQNRDVFSEDYYSFLYEVNIGMDLLQKLCVSLVMDFVFFKQIIFHFQLTNANSGPVSRNPEDQEQMNTESVKLAIHFLFNTYYHVKWGGVDDGGGGGEDDGDRIMEDIVNSATGYRTG